MIRVSKLLKGGYTHSNPSLVVCGTVVCRFGLFKKV